MTKPAKAKPNTPGLTVHLSDRFYQDLLTRPTPVLDTPGVSATLNVRVAPTTRSVVDLAAQILGVSVREVVERAVIEKYSAQFLNAHLSSPHVPGDAHPSVIAA